LDDSDDKNKCEFNTDLVEGKLIKKTSVASNKKISIDPETSSSSSSSSIFNVNIITPTSRGDILRQIASSVYIA